MFNIYKPDIESRCSYVSGKVLNKTEIGCDHGNCKDCPYRQKQFDRLKHRRQALHSIGVETGKIDKRMFKNVRTLNKDQLVTLRDYIDELIDR